MKGAKRKNDGPLQLEGLTTVCVRQKGGGGGGGGGGESFLLVCALLSLKIYRVIYSQLT